VPFSIEAMNFDHTPEGVGSKKAGGLFTTTANCHKPSTNTMDTSVSHPLCFAIHSSLVWAGFGWRILFSFTGWSAGDKIISLDTNSGLMKARKYFRVFHSSFIRTLPSTPELHRIMRFCARGLSPPIENWNSRSSLCPEEYFSI
jgi:hypothetical protein